MNDDLREKLKKELEEQEAIFNEKFPSIHFKVRKVNRITNLFLKICVLIVLAGITGGMVTELSIKSKYSEMVNTVHERIYSNEGPSSYQQTIDKIRKSIVSISDSEENLKNKIYSNHSSTGIIIDKYNKIITSYSNIKGLTDIYVKLPLSENEIARAELIIGDEDLDIAVIQISLDYNLEPVIFSTQETLLAGDDLMLVSNSIGDDYVDTVIPGVITSPNRKITIGKYNDINLLEINTNINDFNKSGGIFNSNGELIGVANQRITNKVNNRGLYYGIDKNLITSFVESVNKVKSYIGVIEGGFVESTEENGHNGFYIERINTSSNGYDAGLRPTDIIYEIDGVKITSMNKMYIALKDKNNNDVVNCKIYKNGSLQDMQIVVQK